MQDYIENSIGTDHKGEKKYKEERKERANYHDLFLKRNKRII